MPADQSQNGQTAAAKTGNAAGSERPILVELFTSEGCSSCPPADELLQKMDASQPVSGAELIVLSEHVDYWDHDGWKDPNSSSALTERQTEYEHVLGIDSPYTPQFIVDGTSVLKAGSPEQIVKLFEDAAAQPDLPVRISDVSVDPSHADILNAHVEADANNGKKNADVYVAVALNHVESHVLRGENGGHRLTHVAVVVELTKIGKLQKGKPFDQTIQLKLKPGIDPKNVRVVAFVQEAGPGKILGSAMKKLTA